MGFNSGFKGLNIQERTCTFICVLEGQDYCDEKIFRSERDEIIEGWREFHNEELYQTS